MPLVSCGCVVTSDAHEALFGCNHLGCIALMPVALCMPFPFSASCEDMLINACLCHPLAFFASLHACLHVHAWVLLASVLSMLQHNEATDIWSKPIFVPCGHHLLFDFLLCLFICLFVFFPAFSFVCASCLSYLLPLAMLARSIIFICLCPIHMLSVSFPSIACLLVSCVCLCMYARGARTHRARVRFPKRKQKEWGCEHAGRAKQLQPVGLGFCFFLFGYVLF